MRHACKGSQPIGLDKLLIKSSWWAGTAPVLRPDGQILGKASVRGQAIHETHHAGGTGTTLPTSPKPATTDTYRRFTPGIAV